MRVFLLFFLFVALGLCQYQSEARRAEVYGVNEAAESQWLSRLNKWNNDNFKARAELTADVQKEKALADKERSTSKLLLHEASVISKKNYIFF